MMNNKPKLSMNINGNIFAVAGAASRALREAGQAKKVDEMTKRIYNSRNYTEALSIISEYVEWSDK